MFSVQKKGVPNCTHTCSCSGSTSYFGHLEAIRNDHRGGYFFFSSLSLSYPIEIPSGQTPGCLIRRGEKETKNNFFFQSSSSFFFYYFNFFFFIKRVGGKSTPILILLSIWIKIDLILGLHGQQGRHATICKKPFFFKRTRMRLIGFGCIERKKERERKKGKPWSVNPLG